ncbi:hypothetical protein AAG570_000966 [Ranatra chinensis]|uniref:Integrator complex subunit 1 n=1 Tax=Ranatra chinensis TaxID=642074 RepID=A0ABD0YAR8_9HEMI
MERGKGSSGRGGKNKAPQFPVNLYPLGPKSNDAKLRPILPKGAGQQPGERDRKREGSSLAGVVTSKKVKTGGLLNRTPGTSANSPAPSSSPSPATSDAWEASALDIDPSEFVIQVLEAAEADDNEKVVGYICGAVKLLRSQRLKPDSVLYESLAYLTKIRPLLFTNECVVNALCSLLKKDNVYAFKTKGNTCVLTLAVSILACAFQNIKKWPEIFVKMYLEDAGGERAWVDNELCKSFVDNIVSSFSTKQIPVSVDPAGRVDQQDDDIVPVLKQPVLSETRAEPIQVIPRSKEAVESLILDCVKEQLSRKQSPDMINRNFLKMLSSLCGIGEIRLLVASRLEAWFQNPKLMRSAQELLMSLCVNCTAHTIKDAEVINCLIKMRLKSKALCTYYLACIKELVSGSSENLSTALKQTIYNELSNSRNPNNMAMLSVMFQYDPEPAALVLAEIFQELLLSREDYLRPLRALLRELSRVLRSELRLITFCYGLMNRTEPLPRDCDNVRVFAATADLISLATFLAVMPHARSEKKDFQLIERTQTVISNIQKNAVWWLQETALGVYRPSPQDFSHALQKVLLLEPAEQYYKVDMWPPEQDRNLFMRMSTEVPVLEETLITVLALGLSKDHPLTPVEALEISEQVVRRAASVQTSIIPVLKTDKIKIFDLVFNLCAYRHPENIDLPTGYSPPTLAISALYWKGWTILLILSAHNPAHMGTVAWQKYPTLRILMEMCITSHFAFPQGFDELQLLALEKQKILEFESHLAAASTKMEITEQTSLLLSQLVTMDPFGSARRPPPPTLELIKSLNTTLRLGHLLCRSRNPDFLLDIIHRQGSSQSMPWLADLVHNSEGALNHLPVQCLCEFLLSTSHKQEGKYQQLLSHLQSILTDPQQDPSNTCEVLDYFLKRLSSPSNRTLAIAGLKLVISPLSEEEGMETDKNKDDTSWLTQQLPILPHFKIARTQIIASLRSACQVENDPNLVTAYLCFLSHHADGDLSEMTDLVLDMAQLIVERSTIMAAILPNTDQPNPALDAFVSIFYNYITKAREPRREAYAWSESQDQVLVTWPTSEECTVHILVVHAIVILLTYGPTAVSKSTYYNHLLDTWFPKEIEQAPKGFLVDTSEEALLIPDWLKLRMIRSHVPRLVEAALTDLDISQLILFIQSFGIPIASMSQLLATLDSAVLTDQDAVGEAVIDKAYMVQLVEVQHRRGAVSGETFTKVLDLLEPSKPQTVDETDFMMMVREKRQRINQRFLSESEGTAALDELFGKGPVVRSEIDPKSLGVYMVNTLVHEMCSTESPNSRTFLVEFMDHLLNRTLTNFIFVSSFGANNEFACPIFRLLTTFSHLCPNLTHLCRHIVVSGINKHLS